MNAMLLGWKDLAFWVVLLAFLGQGGGAVCAGEEGAKKQETYRLTAGEAGAALLALMDTLPDTDPFTGLRDSVKKSKGETDPDRPGVVRFSSIRCDLATETFSGRVGPWPLQWWEFQGKFEKTPTGSWKAILIRETMVQT